MKYSELPGIHLSFVTGFGHKKMLLHRVDKGMDMVSNIQLGPLAFNNTLLFERAPEYVKKIYHQQQPELPIQSKMYS